jgi:protein Tex
LAQLAKLHEHSAQKVVVSESGASVYSASAYASQEFPDLDVSLRGAVSIARRLQDPLAELVKIEPKSIGVGQYQHDVNASALAKSLDAVVEDCVNAVGVDLNTASAPLLSRVSGLGAVVAASVVRHREAHGRFDSRQQLLDVSGLGPKSFEQCAGFLRIANGTNPLDRTGVHPEAYPVVQRMLAELKLPIEQTMGQGEALSKLRAEAFVDAKTGLPTVQDILKELAKPGRDPRPHFQVARFNDGIDDISHLRPGMVLEGTVSNVAQFGAFVDLGVHQDGLVHVSQLAHRFVADAREVVKAGQIVKVQVVEVDVPRKRIGLTMKLGVPANATNAPQKAPFRGKPPPKNTHSSNNTQPSGNTALRAAFAKASGLG